MPSIKRLEQRQKELEAEYDLLSEKISRLKKARILETDPNTRFKLDKQLEDLENERETIEAEIEKTVQAINAEKNIPQASPLTKAKKRPITYSLRPQVKHFVNREKMREQLRVDLRDEQKVIVVVDGLAGIGKTSLAAKVAEEVEDEFSGIYYTKCSSETDVDQLLAELAYFLGEYGDHTLENVVEYNIPQKNKINFLIDSLGKRTANVPVCEKSASETHVVRRYLLIFDDLHELLDKRQTIKDQDLQLFFNKLLTQSHNSKIMLVSRTRPVFHRYQSSQSKKTLEKMDQEGGIELLQILGVEEDKQLLQQAYQLTSGHPLAMELLASLTEVMPLEDILADKTLFYDDVSVAEKLLQELYNTLTPEEQTLLRKIAILPHPATRDLICYLGEEEIPPNPPLEKGGTAQNLNSLVRKALVTYDKKQKIYKQHDLVRDFNRMKMTEEEKKEYHLKAAAYYENLEYNKDKPTFEQVQQRLEVRDHYFQAGEIEKAAFLLVEVSEYLREWGYLERCKTLLEETLKAVESLSPNDERQLLMVDLLVELSWIESSSEGLDKAIDRCKQAEDILKIVEDKRRAGNLYHAMGKFFYEKASWEEADTYLHLSFEIKKEQADTKGIVKTLGALRVLYWNSGELDKIEAISRDGIKVCEYLGDMEHKSEILVNILGKTLEAQRRFDEALSVYEESLRSRNKNDFTGKALSSRLIGQTFRKKKNFENALEKYQESLVFAEESRDVLAQSRALRGIGDTYRNEGKMEEAIHKYDEAVEKIVTSDNLIGKISVLREIAWSYRDTGELDKALEQFKKCLQLSRVSGNIVQLANSLNNIGFLYSTSYSNLDKALLYYTESLEIKRNLGILIGIDLAENNVAYVYKKQGKLDEALKVFEKLLAIMNDPRISNRAMTLGRKMYTLHNIGEIYYDKGDSQRSLEFFKKSLQLCEEGKRLPFKPVILNTLGAVYMSLGNYEEALTALDESAQLHTELYKKAEPLTNIAEVYYRQGNLAEAMTKCEESLALSRQYGGRIQAGLTLHLMGKIRMQENNYDEALKYVQEAVDIFKTTGSRHLSEAEATLQEIEERIEHR